MRCALAAGAIASITIQDRIGDKVRGARDSEMRVPLHKPIDRTGRVTSFCFGSPDYCGTVITLLDDLQLETYSTNVTRFHRVAGSVKTRGMNV